MVNKIASMMIYTNMLSTRTGTINNDIFLTVLKAQLEQAQKSDRTIVRTTTTECPFQMKPWREIPQAKNNNIASSQYDSLILETSRKYGVDPALTRAVIKTESNFDHKAISSAGAMGLMQLMPETAKSLGVKDAFNPDQNIDGGVRYLKSQLNQNNWNIKLALAAYNCGPGRLKRLEITDLDDPAQMAKLPKETQNYINKVIKG